MTDIQNSAKSQQENFSDLLESFVVAVVRKTNNKLGLFTGDPDKLEEAVKEEKARILQALTQS